MYIVERYVVVAINAAIMNNLTLPPIHGSFNVTLPIFIRLSSILTYINSRYTYMYIFCIYTYTVSYTYTYILGLFNIYHLCFSFNFLIRMFKNLR